MNIKIPFFWKKTPELNNILDVGELTATTTGAGLGLAIALGVANPALMITAAGLAFASPIKKVIEVAASRGNQKLTLEEVVAIAAPLVYVKSFNYWIERNSLLKDKINQKNKSSNEVNSIIADFTLDRQLATNALTNFHESELGITFNQILSSQLHQYELSEIEIDITVTWVAWKAGFYFEEIIEEIKSEQKVQVEDIKRLEFYLRSRANNKNDPYTNIEKYQNEQISKAPKETVFNEDFSFEDIYVSLKVKPVNIHGQIINNSKAEKIEPWAKSLLLNPKKAKQVLFIQGAPGRGKSVFCKIFSDWIRQNYYPFWIPILIRLRDIESFDNILVNTLEAAIKNRFTSDKNWLLNSELRFLFILDGFDEIHLEGRARGGLERFIKQVASYQENCNISQTSEMGHRFILTGRQLALQGISFLPDNLERVELLPMNNRLQKQWLKKWEKVVDKDINIAKEKTSIFKLFLLSNDVPREVKEELAKEPLLLYLLAAMHRDNKINIDKLTGKNRIENEISIYEQAINWVLTEQRHPPIQNELVRLKTNELKQILIEAGIAVIQSGGESARITTVENWLKKSRPKIAEKIKIIRETKGDEVLKNALAAFYIKPKSDNFEESTIEFYHSSFGEFLCAKRFIQSIKKWVKRDEDGDSYEKSDDEFSKDIYDIFGYGSLTPDITKYLFGLLKKDDDTIINLFERLENFYLRWCREEFCNTSGTTFAQDKMTKINEELPDKKLSLGQNSVEVLTVINVLIILFELHSLSQDSEKLKDKINFHPCGIIKRQLDNEKQLDDSNRLLKIIGLSYCLGLDGFAKSIGSFMSGANLSRANFSGANLSGINLSGANLSRAKLRQTDLTETNFSGTNLSDCDLCRCDLTGANLQGAILENAYLRGADCRNAKFEEATLNGADLCRAYLHNADFRNAKLLNTSFRKTNLDAANFESTNFSFLLWDVHTNWFLAKGLHKVDATPNELLKNSDYAQAIKLSKAYEMLDRGNISEAISICNKVAENIKIPSLQAHIYNRFAWLCSLQNKNNKCREEIINLADKACNINSSSGNYKDTYAITIMLHPNFDMPGILGDAGDNELSNETIDRPNPYASAIELLEEALECEDFKKLALPNMEKIKQRRKDWIKSLNLRINPLTADVIQLLLKEEY